MLHQANKLYAQKEEEWAAMDYVESELFRQRSMFWAEMAIKAAFYEGEGNGLALLNAEPDPPSNNVTLSSLVSDFRGFESIDIDNVALENSSSVSNNEYPIVMQFRNWENNPISNKIVDDNNDDDNQQPSNGSSQSSIINCAQRSPINLARAFDYDEDSAVFGNVDCSQLSPNHLDEMCSDEELVDIPEKNDTAATSDLSPMHKLKVFLAQDRCALFNLGNTVPECSTSDDDDELSAFGGSDQSSIIECAQRTPKRLKQHNDNAVMHCFMDVDSDDEPRN